MDLDHHQTHAVSAASVHAQPSVHAPPSAPLTPAAASGATPTAGTDSEIKGRFKVKHITTDTVLAGTAIKAQVVVVGTTPTAAHTPSAQPHHLITSSQGGSVASTSIPMPTAPPGLIRIPSVECADGASMVVPEAADAPDIVSKAPKKSRFTVKTISKEDDRSESSAHSSQDRVTPTLPASGSSTPAANLPSGSTSMASSASSAHGARAAPAIQAVHGHHHHAHHHHAHGATLPASSPQLVTGAVAHASMLLTPAKTQSLPASSMQGQGHSHQKALSARDDQIERMMQILEINNKILLTLSGQISVEDHPSSHAAPAFYHSTVAPSHPPPSHSPSAPQLPQTAPAQSATQHQVQSEKDALEPPALSRSLSMNTGLVALASGAPSAALQTSSAPHHVVSSLVPFTASSSTTASTGTAAVDQSFARFAHHLTEMKKELEIFGKSKRENATEIQRLREKCQQLEDKAAAEHSRCLTLEDRLEKSAQKNRHLLNQIEALTAILTSHNISLDGSIMPVGQPNAVSGTGNTAAPTQSTTDPTTPPAAVPVSASAPTLNAATGTTTGVTPAAPSAPISAMPVVPIPMPMPMSAPTAQPPTMPQAVVAPTSTTAVRSQAPMVPGKMIDTAGLAPINTSIGGYTGLQKPIGLQHSSNSSSFISSASAATPSLQPPISSASSPHINHQSIFHPPQPLVSAPPNSAHLSAPVSNPILAVTNTAMMKHPSGSMNYPNMAASGAMAGGSIVPPTVSNPTMNIISSSSAASSGAPTASSARVSGPTPPLLRPPQG